VATAVIARRLFRRGDPDISAKLSACGLLWGFAPRNDVERSRLRPLVLDFEDVRTAAVAVGTKISPHRLQQVAVLASLQWYETGALELDPVSRHQR
jgi:hypothetical protein